MTNDFFFIPCNGKFEKLWLASIVYFHAVNGSIEVISREGTIRTEGTMTQLLNGLPADLFCQIHRSYIVSLDHILYFDDDEIHMRGAILPIEEKFSIALKNKVTILSASIEAIKYTGRKFYIDAKGNLLTG